ncbi:MAG: Sec-independent protein translocase protein TatB [Rhodobacteraceae bacterium]|nr:Sec-independent protein translocase protein TatB [Paracoccaceae bacterium]
MFDIGFAELLVIGVVALIVVGPKDLPGMFRTLGKFTAKARAMAREFQSSLEAAADDSGVGDIAKDLKKVTSAKSLGLDSVTDAVKGFHERKYDPEQTKREIEETKKLMQAGENTRALAEKREAEKAAVADRVAEAKAKKAEAAVKAEAAPKKPAAKKPPAKKPAAKKPAAKKPAARTAPAKPADKPAPAKSAKKPAAKKPEASAKAAKTAAKPTAKRAAKVPESKAGT